MVTLRIVEALHLTLPADEVIEQDRLLRVHFAADAPVVNWHEAMKCCEFAIRSQSKVSGHGARRFTRRTSDLHFKLLKRRQYRRSDGY